MSPDDLVRQLRRNADWRDERWRCITDPALLVEAADLIEQFVKRLEVVQGWNEGVDGISCRDETIRLQDARIERLEADLEKERATVRRVQSAAKTIMHAEGEELKSLREKSQAAHLAVLSLDSEREANARLTDEIESLRAQLAQERLAGAMAMREACAKVADEAIMGARLGEIDSDLRCVGHHLQGNIRALDPASVSSGGEG